MTTPLFQEESLAREMPSCRSPDTPSAMRGNGPTPKGGRCWVLWDWPRVLCGVKDAPRRVRDADSDPILASSWDTASGCRAERTGVRVSGPPRPQVGGGLQRQLRPPMLPSLCAIFSVPILAGFFELTFSFHSISLHVDRNLTSSDIERIHKTVKKHPFCLALIPSQRFPSPRAITTLPHPTAPGRRESTFFLWMCLFRTCPKTESHPAHPSGSASLTENHVSRVHPHCSLCQSFTPFHGCVIFHWGHEVKSCSFSHV